MKKILNVLVLGAVLASGTVCFGGCSQTAMDSAESTEEEVTLGEDNDSSRSIFSDDTRIGRGTDRCRGGGRGRGGRGGRNGGCESSRW